MLPDLPNTLFHHFFLYLGEITFLKFMGQKYYESIILGTVICPRTRFKSNVSKCTAIAGPKTAAVNHVFNV